MVKLLLEPSKHANGFVHVQTNPYCSYDTQKTVKKAQSEYSYHIVGSQEVSDV